MKTPQSSYYNLEKLIAQTGFSQAWIATRSGTRFRCFLKVFPISDSLPTELAELITSSFHCQQDIHHRSVLRARRLSQENGFQFLEYPFLGSGWKQLTPPVLVSDAKAILAAIAAVVDLIHLLGYVHCDLKLSNFLVRTINGRLVVKLVDTDLLCHEDTDPKSIVRGSLSHIAPEIETNDRIVVQSDLYSIGVSLRLALQSTLEEDNCEPEVLACLHRLSESLTISDYRSRPRFLIDALTSSGLISDDQCNRGRRGLLGNMLRSEFNRLRLTQEPDAVVIQRVAESCRVFGFSEEMLRSLGGFWQSTGTIVPQVRRLLEASVISRIGKSWLVSPTDDALWRTYQTCSRGLSEWGRKGSDSEPASSLDQARRLRDERNLEQAYFLLSDALDKIDDSECRCSEVQKQRLEQELADLAMRCNRIPKAIELLQRVTEPAMTSDRPDYDAAYSLARLLTTSGRMDDAIATAHQYGTAAKSTGNMRQYYRFLVLQIWYQKLLGKPEHDGINFDSIATECGRLGFADIEVKSLYGQAVFERDKGELHEAERLLQRALELAKQQKMEMDVALISIALAKLHNDAAKYGQAMQLLQSVLGRRDQLLGPDMFLSACESACISSLRGGEFSEADHWMQHYLAKLRTCTDAIAIADYHIMKALLNMELGALRQAEDDLREIVDIDSDIITSRNRGKLYQNLAMVALLRGMEDQCQLHVAGAREFFRSAGDGLSVLELDAIDAAFDSIYGEAKEPGQLMRIASELIRRGSNYYGGLCVFYALASSEARSTKSMQMLWSSLKRSTADGPPLFTAVDLMMRSEGNASRDTRMSNVRDACTTVRGLGVFQGMLLQRVLGRLYAGNGRHKNAEKHFQQALRQATFLGNRRYSEMVTKDLESVVGDKASEERIRNIMSAISTVLSSSGSIQDTSRRLIRFAVEESGAERGVLLQKKPRASKLVPVAACNIDKLSIKDVQSFSSSITTMVDNSTDPVFVEDAQQDGRTSQFKSVVAHNIKSVVCVPVRRGRQLLGALYLDHHSIPHLFSDDDKQFVTVIANFIAAALSLVQETHDGIVAHRELLEELRVKGMRQPFLTRDEKVMDILRRIPEIAQSGTSVLILGESGTGKELLADMLHDMSPRAKRPFVKLNCGSIADSLVESELFGVVKGTATGVDARDGKLAASDEGSLLLDEIGDMPMEMQVKLLRVIEQGEFQKVGSNRTVHVDTRFVYSTNKSLANMVKSGTFREDLYYRVNVLSLEIPPLRKRKGDIELLLEHYIGLFSAGKSAPVLSGDVRRILMDYNWPGNVRELRNLAERLCLLYPGHDVSEAHLPAEFTSGGGPHSITKHDVDSAEELRIRETLARCGWNKAQAARDLGLTVSTLRRRMKKLRIEN